jgi:hypothetical protein
MLLSHYARCALDGGRFPLPPNIRSSILHQRAVHCLQRVFAAPFMRWMLLVRWAVAVVLTCGYFACPPKDFTLRRCIVACAFT